MLSSQSQLSNYIVVALDVDSFQIIEQAATLRDHLQQASSGMVVLFVRPEMLGKFVDAPAQ